MKKILYVEDSTDTADAVCILLKHAGYDAQTVACGKDALKIAGRGFDLFLLDVMLPDMSGWDIFEKIKGKIKGKVIFLSAIPVTKERLTELQKSGVTDYITKPFEKDDLLRRVKSAVGE
jgi:DNA-binding response OmpR family regulator